MMRFAYIAAGGAIGAVARYAVGVLAVGWMGGAFAWGTLCVNLCGSLLIGLLAGVAHVAKLPPGVEFFAITGLLGAFTTFSMFSLETVDMLRGRQYGLAATNVAASCFFGVVLVFIGFLAVRYVAELVR